MASFSFNHIVFYKSSVFVLTFLSYAIYTATRLPYSITKSTLAPEDADKEKGVNGWAPFNGDRGSFYLGALDATFLIAYAFGLVFVGGPLGDRVNLRYFLGIGMILSSIACLLYGMAYFWSIHNFFYFVFCNIFAGIAQSTGWPGCVTVMTRWWGKGSRGTVMGIWNSHSSVGSIIGKLVATAALRHYGWAWSFLIPAFICAAVGILQLLFLIPKPSDVLTAAEMKRLKEGSVIIQKGNGNDDNKLLDDSNHNNNNNNNNDHPKFLSPSIPRSPSPHGSYHALHHHDHDHSIQLPAHLDDQNDFSRGPTPIPNSLPHHSHHDDDDHHDDHDHHDNVPFLRALLLPGVIPYSLCLFFSKFVAYAFIFWLPYYLKKIGYSQDMSGDLSTLYDGGGIVGGVVAGLWSDRIGKRGLVSVIMLIASCPVLYIYSVVASQPMAINGLVMFFVGILVNGPYTLVSSAVAADLAQHPSLKGNPKAMSTVTGIIDGTGTLGSAAQGLLIGWVGGAFGWNAVLYMLIVISAASAACISRAAYHELYHSHPSHTSLMDDHSKGHEALTVEHHLDGHHQGDEEKHLRVQA